MVDYADMFLSDGLDTTDKQVPHEETGERINYADEFLTGDLGPEDEWIGYNPLNSVMTPDLAKQKDSAGFLTNLKAGLADDPQTQLRVYAASRFPDMPEQERLKRYGIHKGEIIYEGKDGKLYRETADSWYENIKRFAAKTGSHLPTLILSTIGSFGGPGLAALGAAGGEGIRKSTANVILDEPQTVMGNVASMAKEGALAFGGDVAGRGIASGINKAGAIRGGKLASAAGRNRNIINAEETKRLERLGKEFGIDLYPPQTTGSRLLADKFNLLGDLESSSKIIQRARTKQIEQIDDAVYKFFKKLSPSSEGASSIGEQLKTAAGKTIDASIKIRSKKAAPIYQKAFEESGPVNIKPVISFLEKKLKTAKGGVRQHLLRAKKSIMSPDLPKKTLLDSAGKPISSESIYDTTLKGLHDAKIEIDRLIGQAAKDSQGNIVKRNYMKVKNLLLDQMDKASPDYKKARQIFSSYSEEVAKQGKKTLIYDISKLEGDKVSLAAKKLLSSPEAKRDPLIILKIKRKIVAQDEDVWNKAIVSHLQDLFESTKLSSTGEITNIGGHFYKKVWGDLGQRRVLKAAMDPEHYKALENFMKVLERSGMILSKESATATRQTMLEQMGGKGLRKGVRAIVQPLYTKKRLFGDALLESILHKKAKLLAEAMTSKSAAEQLNKMFQLGPSAEKAFPAMTNFLSMVSYGAFSRGHEKESKKDVLPESVTGPK